MPTETKTRFAPSPTGFLHVGGLRTALYNFLYARKQKGKFALRIEDTDKTREVAGALENITETLNLFDLKFDGELVKQSGRLDIYKKHASELIEKKSAYYCFCITERLEELRKQQQLEHQAPKYDKHCLKLSAEEIEAKLDAKTPYVVRLNVPPGQKIKFTDAVYGEIEIWSDEIDDQILLKSDGYPTYHLANVVDDHLMDISHVIRGEEWIPSTPKHILLYQAFGWDMPQFAHLPLLLSISKKKLSKREGDVAVKDFLALGYLPEALLNFVALLGWNPKTEQEIFSLEELIEQFSLEKVNKSGAVFDLEKLDWVNSVYIRKLENTALLSRIAVFLKKADIDTEKYPTEFLIRIIALEKERLKKLSEIGERVKYFFEEPKYDPSLLVWKKSEKEIIKQNLEKLHQFIQSNDPSEEKIKKFIVDQNLKTGEVLWPLRVALTGLDASPGPFEIIDAFLALPNGKEIVLNRLKQAASML